MHLSLIHVAVTLTLDQTLELKFPVKKNYIQYRCMSNYIHVSGITPVFSGVSVTRSLVLCVYYVDRCLSFFFWPLYCLFFFDLRTLITSLVSSNSSYTTSIFLSPYFYIISIVTIYLLYFFN